MSPLFLRAKSFQSCPTLCNPMDYSLPDSCVHGISQARIPVWVAFSFSRGPSQPRDRTCVSYVSCIGRRVLYTSSATWEALGVCEPMMDTHLWSTSSQSSQTQDPVFKDSTY